MSRDYCEACGYTDSHDPNCPRPRDDAQDDKPRTLAQRLAAEVNRNGDGMIPLTVALRVVEEAEGECCPEDYGLIEYVAVLKAQLQRAQSADVCSACGAKEGEPCRGNCERRMPSHVLRSETPVEWHEREKVAFEAWWQARADGYGKSYDVTAEPAVLAAGAAWFARAQQCTPSATTSITQKELEQAVNRLGLDNDLNTPDYQVAEIIFGNVESFRDRPESGMKEKP
jgi:hypothetical protein